MSEDRTFPIQRDYDRERREKRGGHPKQIPWAVAEMAYGSYADHYGKQQSLERLAKRGGFCPGEMDEFCPDWIERCARIAEGQDRIAALEAENERLRADIEYLRAALEAKTTPKDIKGAQ